MSDKILVLKQAPFTQFQEVGTSAPSFRNLFRTAMGRSRNPSKGARFRAALGLGAKTLAAASAANQVGLNMQSSNRFDPLLQGADYMSAIDPTRRMQQSGFLPSNQAMAAPRKPVEQIPLPTNEAPKPTPVGTPLPSSVANQLPPAPAPAPAPAAQSTAKPTAETKIPAPPGTNLDMSVLQPQATPQAPVAQPAAPAAQPAAPIPVSSAPLPTTPQQRGPPPTYGPQTQGTMGLTPAQTQFQQMQQPQFQQMQQPVQPAQQAQPMNMEQVIAQQQNPTNTDVNEMYANIDAMGQQQPVAGQSTVGYGQGQQVYGPGQQVYGMGSTTANLPRKSEMTLANIFAINAMHILGDGIFAKSPESVGFACATMYLKSR